MESATKTLRNDLRAHALAARNEQLLRPSDPESKNVKPEILVLEHQRLRCTTITELERGIEEVRC